MENLIKIIGKHVDEKGLALELIAVYAEPALKELAAKTENKIDDMAVEAIIAALHKSMGV
jgi:hypothetical protein